jgi:catechol 2,3-dioxygenase-like lactoylglutathione lyase family enzyme
MFIKTDHTGVSVEDMDKAIAFYRDVIGMEKTFDREFDAPITRLTSLPDVRVRVVHMKLGGSAVELFEYKQPRGRPPAREHRQNDFGLTHIGFLVDDFWGTYQRLVDKGVRFLGEPVPIREGVTVAYFYGAEHEVCEMREILPDSPG